MSSILSEMTEDPPFYDLRTSPFSENQTRYPEASPATMLPLLMTDMQVG